MLGLRAGLEFRQQLRVEDGLGDRHRIRADGLSFAKTSSDPLTRLRVERRGRNKDLVTVALDVQGSSLRAS